MPIFKVFALNRSGIEPESTVSVLNAYSLAHCRLINFHTRRNCVKVHSHTNRLINLLPLYVVLLPYDYVE